MVQCVTDCLGRRPASRQFCELRFEPDAQFDDQRLALGLTGDLPLSGSLAADIGLNRIECGNPFQRFDRDRRVGLGQIIEAPAHVAPAKC